MARIVKMKDHKPLAIKKSEMEEDVLWVCRCGLSADWPWCDSSHKLAREEEPGKTYRYRRRTPGGELEREELAAGVPEADPRPDGEAAAAAAREPGAS